MKYLILAFAITLTACGGAEYSQGSDPIQDDEMLCYGMGGTPELLQVYNISTNETTIEVDCDFADFGDEEPAQCEQPICKPGAQCPVAECGK